MCQVCQNYPARSGFHIRAASARAPTPSKAPLGVFSFVGAGGQTDKYVPMYDSFGNLARITLGGTNTLRVTNTTAAGVKLNFFILVPARTDLPAVAEPYPNGLAPFQSTNELAFTVASGNGIATTNIQVTLNGANIWSNLFFSGSATRWNVSFTNLLSKISMPAIG